MTAAPVSLIPLGGIPLVEPGDNLAGLLETAVRSAANQAGGTLEPGDIVVIAQKIVSKAEGRYAVLDGVEPSLRALALAEETGKDPRFVEILLGETKNIIRTRPGLIIVETHLGLIMANAGIDRSNITGEGEGERVLLLPEDPDKSAAGLKQALDAVFECDIGVIISDSFGRPWRMGVTGVAIGAAGVPALGDLVGTPDLFGRPLEVTEHGFADEVSCAASLLMGQGGEGVPAVIARGLAPRIKDLEDKPASALIRPRAQDLFR